MPATWLPMNVLLNKCQQLPRQPLLVVNMLKNLMTHEEMGAGQFGTKNQDRSLRLRPWAVGSYSMQGSRDGIGGLRERPLRL